MLACDKLLWDITWLKVPQNWIFTGKAFNFGDTLRKYECKSDGHFISFYRCRCDLQLGSCLRSARNRIANLIGRTFFNVAGDEFLYRPNCNIYHVHLKQINHLERKMAMRSSFVQNVLLQVRIPGEEMRRILSAAQEQELRTNVLDEWNPSKYSVMCGAFGTLF